MIDFSARTDRDKDDLVFQMAYRRPLPEEPEISDIASKMTRKTDQLPNVRARYNECNYYFLRETIHLLIVINYSIEGN